MKKTLLCYFFDGFLGMRPEVIAVTACPTVAGVLGIAE
jgi:hypothetical protein